MRGKGLVNPRKLRGNCGQRVILNAAPALRSRRVLLASRNAAQELCLRLRNGDVVVADRILHWGSQPLDRTCRLFISYSEFAWSPG